MYTDITLITLAIRARKFKAKVNISSRKLFLAGQKIAGISGLDMLLHYVTQDKIFPFPKQLPTQAGSCTRQAQAQLKGPLETSSLDFCLPPCPPSSLLLSTRFNFASIHAGKIERLHPHESLDHPCLCVAGGKVTSIWDPHSQLGGTLKLQGSVSQIQRRKIYCRHWGCRAWHFPSPPTTLAIPGEQYLVCACALAILSTPLHQEWSLIGKEEVTSAETPGL